MRAHTSGSLIDQVFCAFLGTLTREDFVPYVADFFLQLEGVKWTAIAGVVGDTLVVSVRNLGYSKNAGEFARRFFSELGSAGGHRAMAKAVVPMAAFRAKYGTLDAPEMGALLHTFVSQFLRDNVKEKEREKEEVRAR
jgi:nanoRNase/pAp phosphatase (c-di-AMP/oligoRNAs hydrolase)